MACDSCGYGPGAHSHVIFGRTMIHTHKAGSEFVGTGPASLPISLSEWREKLGLFHFLRPLVVGTIHGLAGSAAVTLLVLTTIRQPGWAIAYLLVFGVGTIAGMMLITAAIALPFTYTLGHFARLNQGLATASGIISLSFGLVPVLPNWNIRRVVHGTSELDASLKLNSGRA